VVQPIVALAPSEDRFIRPAHSEKETMGTDELKPTWAPPTPGWAHAVMNRPTPRSEVARLPQGQNSDSLQPWSATMIAGGKKLTPCVDQVDSECSSNF